MKPECKSASKSPSINSAAITKSPSLRAKSRSPGRQKRLLTGPYRSIILSASVDINGLIESGGGTGPLKPRQPTQGASLSDQVPNPAQVTETNEETRTRCRNLFSNSMGRGLFLPPSLPRTY